MESLYTSHMDVCMVCVYLLSLHRVTSLVDMYNNHIWLVCIDRRELLGGIQGFLHALLSLSKESARNEDNWSRACDDVRSSIEEVLKGMQLLPKSSLCVFL